MLDRKEGVVIPINRAREGGFRGQGTLEDTGRQVPRGSCFAILEVHSRAPLDERVRELINAPESLFRVGGDLEASFSSDRDIGIGRAAGALLNGLPIPEGLPDFGIHLSERGSSLFATIVDRSRKVIVQAEIGSQYSDSGSWSAFGHALDDALAQSETMTARKSRFGFVVNKGGIISVI
jgi:hypothetical protein